MPFEWNNQAGNDPNAGTGFDPDMLEPGLGGDGGADDGTGAGTDGDAGGGDAGGGDPKPTPPVGMDPNTVKTILSEVLSQHSAKTKEEPKEEPLIPEAKLRQIMDLVNPSMDAVAHIKEGGEGAVNALRSMLMNTMRATMELSQTQLQRELQALRGEYEPVQQQLRTIQSEQLKARFFQQHKDLVGYEPLIGAVRDQLVAEGKSFSSEKDAFAEVAKRTKAMVAQFAKKGGSTMPSLAGGRGGGGAGNTNQGSAGKSTAARIFG